VTVVGELPARGLVVAKGGGGGPRVVCLAAKQLRLSELGKVVADAS
jgi:hypothetical protein